MEQVQSQHSIPKEENRKTRDQREDRNQETQTNPNPSYPAVRCSVLQLLLVTGPMAPLSCACYPQFPSAGGASCQPPQLSPLVLAALPWLPCTPLSLPLKTPAIATQRLLGFPLNSSDSCQLCMPAKSSSLESDKVSYHCEL